MFLIRVWIELSTADGAWFQLLLLLKLRSLLILVILLLLEMLLIRFIFHSLLSMILR